MPTSALEISPGLGDDADEQMADWEFIGAIACPDNVSEAEREPQDHDADSPQTWRKHPLSAFAAWTSTMRHRGTQFEAHSLEQYGSMWKHYCAWLNALGLNVLCVRATDIERFLLSLRGGRLRNRPVAASTKRRYLFLLNRAYAHLVLIEAIKANPVAQLGELASHRAQPRPARVFLTPQQEAAYIDWCLAQPAQRWDQLRNRALRLLFLASGITVAESRMLKAADVTIAGSVDLCDRNELDELNAVVQALSSHGDIQPRTDVRGHVGINASTDLNTGATTVVSADVSTDTSADISSEPFSGGGSPSCSLTIAGHGRVPARQAPVAGFAVSALQQWLQACPVGATGQTLFAAGRPSAIGYIIDPTEGPLRPSDDPLSAEEIYEIVAEALRGIGFDGPRAGPATLRNSFMARQIRAGVPLLRIRDWVGLKSTDQLLLLQRQVPARLDGVWPH